MAVESPGRARGVSGAWERIRSSTLAAECKALANEGGIRGPSRAEAPIAASRGTLLAVINI